VNAYEVEAGIGVIAGNTVWSMPERLECEVLQKSALYKYTYLYLLPFLSVTVCVGEWSGYWRSNVIYVHWCRCASLSLDSQGRVLVADWGNNHILLLTSQLQLQRVLIDTNSQVKLWRPYRLYYNEHTSQLYVAHSSSEEWRWPPRSDVISVLSLHWCWVTDWWLSSLMYINITLTQL